MRGLLGEIYDDMTGRKMRAWMEGGFEPVMPVDHNPAAENLTGTFPDLVTCICAYEGRLFAASGPRIYELVDGVWRLGVVATG